MISKASVLGKLPPYRNKWETVVQWQDTSDIVNTMLRYHRTFAGYYDRIAGMFVGRTVEDTCENLFWFCKRNLRYREETVEAQTTAVPNGLLIRGYCDCKGYASFIAGCLSAIKRMGLQDLDWCYCFASYDATVSDPYHVFVICYNEKGQEIWVDPTPDANNKTPVSEIHETI